MAAKIVQFVSSGFFGSPQRVADPAHAVGLLGLDTLDALAELPGVVFPLNHEDSQEPFFLALNRHCRLVAEAARAVAESETDDRTLIGDAYLSGLLHDIGILVLAKDSPEHYLETVALARMNKSTLKQAEKKTFDTTRDDVGAYLRRCGISGRNRLCRPPGHLAGDMHGTEVRRSHAMNERILCVDDDPNILQAYQRALRKRLNIEPALGGEEALTAIVDQGPYAVVVADMRMPGMNGVQLLAKVKEITPDTVRMMLTGNADQQTALEAVNEGQIFRFMTKPCSPEDFAKVLEAGIAQYRLVTAERELLSKTLSGSVKVLTDILSLASPVAFGRASRVRRLASQLASRLRLDNAWQIAIGAMLSQVGCVAVPDEILNKAYQGKELSRKERDAFEAYPLVGRELISHIPRLEEVAEIIAYQDQRFDGGGFPPDGKQGKAIPTGSRVLKVALDFDALALAEISDDLALAEMNNRPGWYDPVVLDALQKILAITEVQVVREVRVHDLVDGAIIANDVLSLQGTLLCAKGQEVTPSLRARLRNYVTNIGIQGAIKIMLPKETADQDAVTPYESM